MKSLGYITLAEAEKLSGIKADTLKKRCQEGKISGAIKTGKTWFVPRKQIIQDSSAPNDDAVLRMLVTLAQTGIQTNVTLFIGGLAVSGLLISSKQYFQTVKTKVVEEGVYNGGGADAMKAMFTKIFDTLLEDSPNDVKEILDKPVNYIHMTDVRVLDGSIWEEGKVSEMRFKISAVDGFCLGRSE